MRAVYCGGPKDGRVFRDERMPRWIVQRKHGGSYRRVPTPERIRGVRGAQYLYAWIPLVIPGEAVPWLETTKDPRLGEVA